MVVTMYCLTDEAWCEVIDVGLSEHTPFPSPLTPHDWIEATPRLPRLGIGGNQRMLKLSKPVLDRGREAWTRGTGFECRVCDRKEHPYEK